MDDQASQSGEGRKRKYVRSGQFTQNARRERAKLVDEENYARLTSGVVFGRDGLTNAARYAVLHAIFDPFLQDFNTRLLDHSHAERLAKMDYSSAMLGVLADEATVAVIRGWLSRFNLELSRGR
jgi:hypothetical protein